MEQADNNKFSEKIEEYLKQKGFEYRKIMFLSSRKDATSCTGQVNFQTYTPTSLAKEITNEKLKEKMYNRFFYFYNNIMYELYRYDDGSGSVKEVAPPIKTTKDVDDLIKKYS